jgi:tetratricopeptide (TPR) repeat protein
LQGIAALYDTRNQLNQAMDYYLQALDAANRAGDARTIAAAHYNLGAILVDENRDEEARNHLLRARDEAEAIRDFPLAERARQLLTILAPPSSYFSDFGSDDESTDLPISELPSRPRQYPPAH